MQSTVWAGGLAGQVTPAPDGRLSPEATIETPEEIKCLQNPSERDQMLLRNLFTRQHQVVGEQSEEEAALGLLRIK